MARPANTKLLRSLALAYLKVGEVDLANEIFTQTLSLKGCAQDTWFAHYMLGNLAERRNDTKAAMEQFSAGQSLNPNRVECSYGLARQLATAKQPEKALALCQKIVVAACDSDADYLEPDVSEFKAAIAAAN